MKRAACGIDSQMRNGLECETTPREALETTGVNQESSDFTPGVWTLARLSVLVSLRPVRDERDGPRIMNWALLRRTPWLDTRAGFVSRVPRGGRLLDLGSSDGETLNHMAELRPDLQFMSVDIEGMPQRYPKGCEHVRADLETDRLPWEDVSVDAVTCMHLVEHLRGLTNLFAEVARVLKPGGKATTATRTACIATWEMAHSRT